MLSRGIKIPYYSTSLKSNQQQQKSSASCGGWETRVKSSVLLLMGAKSSVLFLMGTKSSVLLVLCTLAVELRNGGRHPFGDCTLRMELRDSHISHSLSSILYVQYLFHGAPYYDSRYKRCVFTGSYTRGVCYFLRNVTLTRIWYPVLRLPPSRRLAVDLITQLFVASVL